MPIIMVGPGTGIAPFRAFLEERIAIGAPGHSWLFFGNQHEASDFLYRDRLLECVHDGSLSRLNLAWSRNGIDKHYVQHKMHSAGKDLFAWLEEEAHFYVCGDASRMANDVDETLKCILATYGAMTPAAAGEYVDELIADLRYQRDEY